MNSISSRIFIVLGFIFLLSCSGANDQSSDSSNIVVENPAYGEWQNREVPPPVSLELEQTFGAESEEQGTIFARSGSIRGPVVDSLNNIYMLDADRFKLISFDPEGNMRWETGAEGRGPGDFNSPRGLATDGEYLYMDNINRSRIDRFDMKGNFIESYTLDDSDLRSVEVKGCLPNGLLVTTSTLMGTLGTQVNIFDPSDNMSIVSRFDISVAEDLNLGKGLGSGVGISIVDSLIAAGHMTEYSIRMFNHNGELVKDIRRSFDKLVRPGFYQSGNSRGIMDFGGLNAPTKLNNGYLLTTLRWPTNVNDPDNYALNGNFMGINWENSVDLFDENGTLLYSYEQEGRDQPEFAGISYVDHNGKVYIKTNQPWPQVRRYSLSINE